MKQSEVRLGFWAVIDAPPHGFKLSGPSHHRILYRTVERRKYLRRRLSEHKFEPKHRLDIGKLGASALFHAQDH